MFKRQLSNREFADPKRLIYSPSQGKVYIFGWKLFSHTDSEFNTSGFKNLRPLSIVEMDRKCMITCYSRLKVSGRVNSQLAIQFNNDCQYWKEVLKRIIAVIIFLALRKLL